MERMIDACSELWSALGAKCSSIAEALRWRHASASCRNIQLTAELRRGTTFRIYLLLGAPDSDVRSDPSLRVV